MASCALAESRAVSVAPAFEPSRSLVVEQGLTCAQILSRAYDQGLIDRAWDPRVSIIVGDCEIPRGLWTAARPLPGRLVAIRSRPGWATIAEYAWDIIVNVAVSYAVSAVLKAFAPDNASDALQQVYSIDSSSNEMVANAPFACVFGRMRVFPRHAARPFTRVDGDKLYLYLLFTFGLGPLSVDESSMKIGDTPLSDFLGVAYQLKLTPDDDMPTLFPKAASEDEGPGVISQADGWVSRTTSSAEADELEIEDLHPEGQIRYKKDGSREGQDVVYRIRYRKTGTTPWLRWNDDVADDDGWLVELLNKGIETPFRDTYTKPVARGQYDVAQKRITNDPGSREKSLIDWTRLRTFANEAPVADDNETLWAVKVEAGDQLNGVIDQFNAVVTRVAPLWDADDEVFGDAGDCRNPAELVRWIGSGPGVAKPRGVDELDDEAFGAWAELCTARGWHCDMELRAGAALSDIMQTVARCGRAVLGERAGKLTPIVDDLQDTAVQHFTPRNSWGFKAQRNFPPDTHAYSLEFMNEDKNFVKDEMSVYFPGYDADSAELIEALAVPGKTAPTEIFRDGKRAIAETLLRGETYTFRADFEVLACQRGKRITASHYVIAVGRRSARVKALTLDGGATHVVGLTLDETIEQSFGETYALEWRGVSGAAISSQTLALTTVPGSSNDVSLAAIGGVPIASAPKVGDLVTFGDADAVTLDLVVDGIAHASDFEAEIRAVAYTAGIAVDDATELPEWSSNVSGDAFPAPPAPIILGAASSAEGFFLEFDFPISTAHLVRSVEAYWRDHDGSPRYRLFQAVPSSLRLAHYPPGEAGHSYDLMLVTVGERGRRTPSAVTTMLSESAGTGYIGQLSRNAVLVATAADGTGGDFSHAGGAFTLAFGSLDVTTGADFAFSVVGAPTGGLSIAIDAATGLYTVSDLTSDSGEATLRASNGATDVDLIYRISKAKAGDDGNWRDVKFKRVAAQPDEPTDAIPTDWFDDIPDGDATLWMTVATKSFAGDLLSLWSSPARLSAFNKRGSYAPAETYYSDDIVTYNGGSYFGLVDGMTGHAPSGDDQANAYWDVLAAPGSPGAPATPPSGFTATINLSSTSAGLNLRTIANANGYTGDSDATITFNVPNGVTITGLAGAPNGGIAIDTGSWPTDYTIALTLVVQTGGAVRGGGAMGGEGSKGSGEGRDGGAGGDALYCRLPIAVTVQSSASVKSGGGGGPGGNGNHISGVLWNGGGGGGGGQPNGPGGAGAHSATTGSDGAAGTTSGGGAGGAGGGGGGHNDGGDGGAYGAAGESQANAGVPGAAGYAIRKNGNTVTVTNSGTITGTQA